MLDYPFKGSEDTVNNNQRKGKMGEIAAARYLRKIGITVLAANYATHFGEIDIIARDKATIAFVEVKTRNPETMIKRPAYCVDYEKQHRIKLTAAEFVKRYSLKNKFRFDIIEVYIGDGDTINTARVEYIKDAFTVKKNERI